MKSSLLIGFIFLLLGCSPKENTPTASQKTCRLQSIKTSQGETGSETKYFYNDTGLLVQQSDSGNVVWDGSTSGIYITTYTYNSSDYLLKKEVALTLLDKSGKPLRSPDKRIENYTYSPEGQLIRNDHYGTGGRFNEPALSDTYEYSNGQLKQATINSYSENRVIKFNAGIPSELISTVVDLTGAAIGITYELNEQGFVKTTRFKLGAPARQYTENYTYDEKGRETKLDILITGDGQGTDNYTFDYDDKKNPNGLIPHFKGFPQYNLYGKLDNNTLKRSLISTAGTFITSWVYEYNSDGYPVKSRATFSSPTDPVTTTYTYIQCN